jgi:hypothetical protein
LKISKNYFSGFCFFDESELFDEYLIRNDFTVSGFSYGAIKAFEEVLNSQNRVDRLQLFSPAFFQTQDDKFKRTQVMYFKKDANSYCEGFLENVVYPLPLDISKYFKLGTAQELQELLYYEWSEEKLQELIEKGVKIEVYLGGKDKIIDALKAKEFFEKFATVYYIKEKGHLL